MTNIPSSALQCWPNIAEISSWIWVQSSRVCILSSKSTACPSTPSKSQKYTQKVLSSFSTPSLTNCFTTKSPRSPPSWSIKSKLVPPGLSILYFLYLSSTSAPALVTKPRKDTTWAFWGHSSAPSATISACWFPSLGASTCSPLLRISEFQGVWKKGFLLSWWGIWTNTFLGKIQLSKTQLT